MTPIDPHGLADRLRWQYGADRARDILQGRDPATERDLAKWNALGGEAPKPRPPVTWTSIARRIAAEALHELRNPECSSPQA